MVRTHMSSTSFNFDDDQKKQKEWCEMLLAVLKDIVFDVVVLLSVTYVRLLSECAGATLVKLPDAHIKKNLNKCVARTNYLCFCQNWRVFA